MGVYARGSKVWIRFRGVGGKWRDASTGYTLGQEALAQATHDEVVARVAASERTGQARGGSGAHRAHLRGDLDRQAP